MVPRVEEVPNRAILLEKGLKVRSPAEVCTNGVVTDNEVVMPPAEDHEAPTTAPVNVLAAPFKAPETVSYVHKE